MLASPIPQDLRVCIDQVTGLQNRYCVIRALTSGAMTSTLPRREYSFDEQFLPSQKLRQQKVGPPDGAPVTETIYLA